MLVASAEVSPRRCADTAAFGLLPAAITFAIGVLASMALRTVPPRQVYEAIDWPVIVVAISVPMLLIVWPL